MFRLGIEETLHDPISIITGFVIYTVLIVIFSSIFAIMPLEKLGDPNLTVNHLIWYFVLTEAIVISNPESNLFGHYISSGRLEDALLRPPSPVLGFLSMAVGKHVTEFTFTLIFGSCFALLFYGSGFPFSPILILPFLVSCFLAILLTQILGYIFSTVEIHGEYSRSFGWFLSKMIFTFGGIFFPVLYFPPLLKTIAEATPFPSTIFAPAQFALPVPIDALWIGIALQLFWIGVCSLLLIVIHRRMVRLIETQGI